ncbi:MAG: PF20097 family protein [Candidatus Thorarchaeota archaeon]
MTESSACPYCGNEMEKGFIVSNYGTWWNDHVPRLICRGGETLASSFWSCAGVPGSKCTTCGIIVLHCGKPRRLELKSRKCSHCGAVYVYSQERIGEDGSVRCQNCDREFLIGI